jgi:hypothetical protein
VGTANAAAAGWGNAGGGAAQALMLLGAVLMLGVSESLGWRIALLVPGVLMLLMAALYWRYTQDCPEGNYADLRRRRAIEGSKRGAGPASRPPAAITAYGCCSSPTAPASASRSSSTTSPPSTTSTISACP